MLIHYVGSFQNNRFVIRTGDQLSAVWREVERMGTVDALSSIAEANGHSRNVARMGSLRIKQAVELRRASKDTSPLTRPLLLYYSCLNLVRGWLSVQKSGMGKPRHGATFKPGASLLECSARIDKDGTIPRMLYHYGMNLAAGTELSLLDCITQIPELKRDIRLVSASPSNIAWVEVKVPVNGHIMLRYHIDECSQDGFSARWQDLLPWMRDECILSEEEPFVIRTIATGHKPVQVTDFCERRLMCDLHLNNNPVWFDHVQRNTQLLSGRLPAYVVMLFILSNICRYEPQLFEEAFKESSNLAYVLDTAISCSERYVPQLFVSAAYGGTVYFE